jgi:transposase-like protein
MAEKEYRIEGENDMAISNELLDQLLIDFKTPKDFDGPNGAFAELKKKIMERAMQAELTDHLGYDKSQKSEEPKQNYRNGSRKKTIITENDQLEVEIPRDRNGTYDPILVGKWQRRLPGFDDKIVALYSRGMTTREITEILKDIYGMDVSPSLISMITDSVMPELEEWRNRQLAEIYPIVYFDAMMVSIRDNGFVKKKAVHLAMGVNLEGRKEVLGMWINVTEGSKFWLSAMNELHNRGVKDILIACADGLTGFDKALEAIFPRTQLQLCIVHMIRNSLKYVSYKDRREMAADLKLVYTAGTAEEAEKQLIAFCEKWDDRYPMAGKTWMNRWNNIIPFFAFPDFIRRAIYTTNAIESLNMTLRKILKVRCGFPNDEAAMKLIYMGLQNISKKWTMPIKDWGRAINQFSIMFGERMA